MKSIITLLIVACVSMYSYGATFTASTSGNWSSSTTWGGTAPGFNISSDQIVIPNGVTVTLDSSLYLNGSLASLTLNGALNSTQGSNMDSLELGLGALTGNGTINAGTVILDSNALFTFSGDITTNYLVTSSQGVHMTANTVVNQSLILMDGIFTIGTGGVFRLANNGTIEVKAGSIATSGAGLLTLNNNYNVKFTGSSATAGPELNGAGLNDVMINLTDQNGSVTLASSLNVTGTLTLTKGMLILNGHNLTVSGNLASSNGGMIYSTSASNVSINTTTSPSGGLRFATNGNTVNNFTVAVSGFNGAVMLGNDLTVQGSVIFNSGSINLDSNTLTLLPGATINGGSNSSYFITADSSGGLAMSLTSGSNTTFKFFPVGTMSHYSPAYVRLNSGSASGTFRVSVADSVRAQGYSGNDLSQGQGMVGATWFLSSNASSNLDLDLRLAWSAAMETSGFMRDSAYISHYTNGSWDNHVFGAATAQGNLYTVDRTHITSLSPFAVFGYRSAAGIAEAGTDNAISISPNPSTDIIYINNMPEKGTVEVMDMQGNILNTFKLNGSSQISLGDFAKGNYLVKITTDKTSVVKRVVRL